MNFIQGTDYTYQNAHSIGIRPEHITISQDKGEWKGLVGVSEHLGSDTFFHVNVEGLPNAITVRADGEVGFQYGDSIYLSPEPSMIHKFNEQGMRIE